jgi:hypothetical protein
VSRRAATCREVDDGANCHQQQDEEPAAHVVGHPHNLAPPVALRQERQATASNEGGQKCSTGAVEKQKISYDPS